MIHAHICADNVSVTATMSGLSVAIRALKSKILFIMLRLLRQMQDKECELVEQLSLDETESDKLSRVEHVIYDIRAW